jgi:FIMAH domain
MRRQYRSKLSAVWTLATGFAVLMGFVGNVSAATLFVSLTSPNPTPPFSSLSTAAHTIQDAVDVASAGDTILVASGQYLLTNQVTVTKGILLQSISGANQTHLIAQSNIWCLWVSNSLALVDGFSLQPFGLDLEGASGLFLANGTARNCAFTNFFLGRLGASVTMSGGVLSNSIATYRRSPLDNVSGIYCSDGGHINNCRVLGQPGGPSGIGVYLVNSDLQASHISGIPGPSGMAQGAALHAISSTITDSTITQNFSRGKGGGAYLENSFMDRCVVINNAVADSDVGAGGGGIFETNSVIRNSLIVSNSAGAGAPEGLGGLGGGVYMQGGALLNCTVSLNAAFDSPALPGAGAGIYVESGGVTNSIIYFNFFQDARTNNWFNSGAGIFDHCCTTPNPGGVGNITQDPQFVGLANGNFHLPSTSPCIDAGIVQPWMTGAFDLDGNPRVRGASVDIGVYESPSETPQELLASLIADVNALVAQGSLSRSSANGLLASLRAAQNSLTRGNTQATCGQVGAFINKIQPVIRNGRLSESDGQSLISTAEDLRAALGCGQ